jgi:DNA-binding IclR family transcriptional regulator
MSEDESDRYRAPALDKGLDILELLARTDGGLTQVEIAKAIGKSPNEFYRMLDRLVRRGYVQRQDGDRFGLTLKLFGLAHLHAPLRRLISYAQPVMRDLSMQAEQACHLSIYDRGAVAVIAQQDSPSYWAMAVRVGAQMNLFTTGSGLVLIAFQSEKERAIMIEDEQRMHGTQLPEGLKAKLTTIQSEGFINMPSQQTAGVRNISAPILSVDGNAIAAITIPFIKPVSGGSADEEACIALVRRAAADISQIFDKQGE